jgi:hypothetical protein
VKHLIDAFRANAEFAKVQEEKATDIHAKGFYYGERLAYADAASKLQAATDALTADFQTLKTGVELVEGRLQ